MTRDFGLATTTIAVSAVWAADRFLAPAQAGTTFVAPGGQQPGRAAFGHEQAVQGAPVDVISQPAAVASAALGTKGLLAFGMGYGALAALVRGAAGVRARRARVSRQAADIEVKEKTETKPVSYLENIPRTIMEKRTLEKLLTTVPKEQWENPPEDSYLYTLKMYAETYGPGKATKMGWFDFWYMRINMPDADEFYSGEEMAQMDAEWRELCTGKIPLLVPGPAGLFYTGATIQWRGPEMFAGDQVQTPVTNGAFATQFVNNLAFYREGLKPWQRGLEIGMAHGYFIIGPFVSLGPLRNTPEAATVGLLAGCALIGIVSVGGLLFGATIKPRLFDKEGDAPAAGYQEMINWHALGGIGGAGFAHALITVFGS
uniref:PSI subunit V n=1 Tax=Alexandrium monilatum TaxID=311494 RepID=A0A7S4T2Y2_9DINO